MRSSKLNDSSPRRIRLFFEWLCIVIGFSTFGMVIRLFTYTSELGGSNFNPWDDLMAMIVISLIGWIIHGLIGPLWLILLSLYLVARTQKRVYFTIAGVTAFICGLFWPRMFWAMMSV